MRNKGLLLFLIVWTILNLFQAMFLDITPDEAYYYVFSQNLSWGYFDHPPVTAFLIKLGYTLIPNVLGVRLLFVLMSTASVYLLYRLITPEKLRLFLIVVLSMIAFHLSGFHALPDVPLLFFTLTYLILLKKYLTEDQIKWALLLAINIALLLLSKYHGVLIIIFTLFALPKLFRRRTFYIVSVVSAILLVPHFLWQYNHDFPSLKFHLIERNWKTTGYDPVNTLKYLVLQPLIAGPIIGVLLFFGAYKNKQQSDFERALRFILWGTYAIFFLLTFSGGEVHWHWTVIALIPLFVLAYPYLEEKYDKLKKAIYIICGVSVFGFVVGRSILFYDYLPEDIRHGQIHGIAEQMDDIEKLSDGNPVVFFNGYKMASRYIFYTGKNATSLGLAVNRRTHFDFLEKDAEIFGKKVCLVDNWKWNDFEPHTLPNGKTIYYLLVDDFVYYPSVRMIPDKRSFEGNRGEEIAIRLKLNNHSYSEDELRHNNTKLPTVAYATFKDGIQIDEGFSKLLADIEPGEYFSVNVKLPEESGNYKLKFGIKCGTTPVTQNSTVIDLSVE